MTTKELKAQNFITQCKLDDALEEIKELTLLVELMEKEKDRTLVKNNAKIVELEESAEFTEGQWWKMAAEHKAEIELMEKEKHSGIEIVAEPLETGLFRIDQMNIMYLHTKAVEYLKKERDVVYETDHIDDSDLISIAHDLAARMESMESDVHEMVDDAVGELAELYHDRIDPSRHDESDIDAPSPERCNKKGCNGSQAFEGETDGLLYCSPKCAGWSNDESDGDDEGLISSTLQCCHCHKTFPRNSEEHDNVTISPDGELIYCMDCHEHCDGD